MNNTMIKEAQQKLMLADPFLVESISSKTVEQLQEQLFKLQSQLTFVSKQSANWHKSHKETIEVIEATLLLRRIGEGDEGGVSLV